MSQQAHLCSKQPIANNEVKLHCQQQLQELVENGTISEQCLQWNKKLTEYLQEYHNDEYRRIKPQNSINKLLKTQDIVAISNNKIKNHNDFILKVGLLGLSQQQINYIVNLKNT